MGEKKAAGDGEEKNKAKKQAVAAVAAAAEKKAVVAAAAAVKKKLDSSVYHTSGGATYTSMDVAGGGMCGLLATKALHIISTGISSAMVSAAANGELTDEMKESVQYLRGVIVDMSDSRLQLEDGEESASSDDVVDNPRHEIRTKGMWKMVTLASRGYLDGFAMELLAEYFGLDGFRIVRAREDGLVVPCDFKGLNLSERDVHLVLFDGYGHFKALVPTEAKAEAVDTEEAEVGPGAADSVTAVPGAARARMLSRRAPWKELPRLSTRRRLRWVRMLPLLQRRSWELPCLSRARMLSRRAR